MLLANEIKVIRVDSFATGWQNQILNRIKFLYNVPVAPINRPTFVMFNILSDHPIFYISFTLISVYLFFFFFV